MNLTNGTYNVTEEIREGFTAASSTFQVVTIAGQNITNVNFTNTPVSPGSISGTKFNDSNGNGVKDAGESGLANWTIILQKSGEHRTSTITDGNGNYSFTNLAAGNYTVAEVLQTGWRQTAPPTGTYTVSLASGQNEVGKDFGNILVIPEQERGSISGSVINKADSMGLSGWKIELKGIGTETSSINKEAYTDSTGFYRFDNLPAGRYIIIENLKKGFVPVSSPVGFIIMTKGENSSNNIFTNRQISLRVDKTG